MAQDSCSDAMESESYEKKSLYRGGDKQRLELVKTIVAMANTKGGEIVLELVEGDARHLDSAALDSTVNRYLEPRVSGIQSEEMPLLGGMRIIVKESPEKPHVFVSSANYTDETGRQKVAFYQGQVWVRHSSGNAEARGDDLRRMVHEAASQFLARVSKRMAEPSFLVAVEGAAATPVRISNKNGAVPVVPDLDGHYPDTATTLGRKLGRNQQWVAKAAEVLGIKDDVEFSFVVKDPKGRVVHRRYSDAAFRRMRAELERNSDWDPWHGS